MEEENNCGKPLEERRGKLTVVLALATLISAFGSSFQYGYNVAVVNSPSLDSFLTLLWSLSVSMYPLGGFFGSLMVAPLVNKLGRKGTLLFNNIFSIVPAVMMGVSEIAKSYEIIIVARVMVGICAGLSSNVVPMYLGELSPKNLRGAIGVVASALHHHRDPQRTGWPLMLGLTGIPALIELLLLPFFPESPRYMLIQRGDDKTARRALQRLRGWEDVDEELDEMRLEHQSEQAEGRLSVLNLLSLRSLRWQLVSIIYYYADSIYSSAGVKESDIQYVTVGTGAVNVFMTITAVFIVEATGRRLLLLESVEWMSNVSIACVIVYVIGHAIGPTAFMVAGSIHWLSNFTVGLVFPFMETKNKTFLEINQMFAHRNQVEIQVGNAPLKPETGDGREDDAFKVTAF
ncbi:unnamed protein product [Coregonus sp. 'balchen']|nr:unnamed protein product [Coregonus sp. 'balchen']